MTKVILVFAKVVLVFALVISNDPNMILIARIADRERARHHDIIAVPMTNTLNSIEDMMRIFNSWPLAEPDDPLYSWRGIPT
jgi:hypothetical protein